MTLFEKLLGGIKASNQRSELAEVIEIHNENIQYDESIKKVLADKQVLARILKYAVEEFSDYSIEDIISWMDDPVISGVYMEPGKTNNKTFYGGVNQNRVRHRLGQALLLQQEDYVKDEGMIKYDIRFNIVHLKRQIKFLINLEAQKSTSVSKLGYHIDNRMIFYIARMISAQKGTEFSKSDYDEIKPVRSIWICMDTNVDEDSIIRFKYVPEVVYGKTMELPNIDKAQGIIIRIRNRANVDKSKNKLISMLEELIKNESADIKNKHLVEEYGFEKDSEFEGRIRTMCNWSEVISEMWYEDGIEKGVRSVIENALKSGSIPEDIAKVNNLMLSDVLKIRDEMLLETNA